MKPLSRGGRGLVSPELIELWRKIEADLRRAQGTLPPVAEGGSMIREYQDFLDHNEFELACDMLEAHAEDHHPVSREFWLALRDASVKMQLLDRAARYESRAAAG
jgi:hypothetical protein